MLHHDWLSFLILIKVKSSLAMLSMVVFLNDSSIPLKLSLLPLLCWILISLFANTCSFPQLEIFNSIKILHLMVGELHGCFFFFQNPHFHSSTFLFIWYMVWMLKTLLVDYSLCSNWRSVFRTSSLVTVTWSARPKRQKTTRTIK